MLPKDRKQVKLKDIADIIMGQSPKSEFYTDDKHDIPFFQWCTEFQDLYPIVRKYCNKPTKIADKWGILMSVRAPVWSLNISTVKCCIGRWLCSMESKEHKDNWFLYYLLKGNLAYIQSNGWWAVYDAINRDVLENLEFSIPSDIKTQQRIAFILSIYDNLIENNARRIKILEEQAQLIYKERFVKFKFPWWEKVKMGDPAKVGAGSGTEFGEIPEGWEVMKLGDTLKTIKRKPKVFVWEYLQKWNIPVIDQGKWEIAWYVNDEKYLQDNYLPMVVFGDHTRILKYVDFPFASWADGTQLLYPNDERLLPVYFFMVVKNIDLKSELYARHFKFLKEKFVIIPEENILREYNDLCKSMFEGISNLQKQNQNFKETRDMLISKLISGEIEI